MKTFVFAIGGTGARVIRAFTMLMAMDNKINHEIIPIIIDMDTQNGDAQRTLKLLDKYRLISEQAYQVKPSNGLFINQYGTLGSITSKAGGGTVDSGVKDSFQLDFGDVNMTFHEYIKGNQLPKVDNDFLETLFNNGKASDPDTELNLKLNHGFKGNPNIGSVVFNNIINTPEFKHFENVFSQGDRIFIISSIFGGTGSSGFPQLVKNIHNSNNNFVKKAPIGAVVVKPYFRVKKDPNSSINSDTFNSKTKSALTYYSDELYDKMSEVYYLADQPGRALENKMGGDEQQNKAHIVELLAAKAVMNFVNKPEGAFSSDTVFHEYGIKDLPDGAGVSELGFDDFYPHDIWTAIAKFSLFAKFFREGLNPRSKQAFFQDLNLGVEMNKKFFYITLKGFVEDYWEWLNEIEQSERSFSPFNLNNEHFDKFFKKKQVKGLDKSFFGDYFTRVMNGLWDNIKKEGKLSNEEKFIKMIYQCIEQAFNEKVQNLPARN